jgi:divalent metal cation (Fe/Co/Zn/Cd) transporter
MFLARESKGLLIGEAALPHMQDAILAIVRQDQAVQGVNGVLTVHMGPREIVAALSVEFEDKLTAPEIEDCVQRLEDRLKKEIPEVTALFVKPQTNGTWETRRKQIAEASDGPQPSGWLR